MKLSSPSFVLPLDPQLSKALADGKRVFELASQRRRRRCEPMTSVL